MRPEYDDTNIFAKILRGEIPNDTVTETEHTLAFRDIRPAAPVHILVIPKGKYVTFDDFAAHATEAEVVDFMRTAAKVAQDSGLSLEVGGKGYRTVSNAGPDGVQEVPHFHLHIVGGKRAPTV